jgi:hypothetical protein
VRAKAIHDPGAWCRSCCRLFAVCRSCSDTLVACGRDVQRGAAHGKPALAALNHEGR